MQTITVVVPAKNEEKNIERCIYSLKWCDKVIVMWMGSDNTGDVARKMGAEVIEMNKSAQDDFVAVQKNINWAIDHVKTDWILRVDADEVVTPELKDEIIKVTSYTLQDTSIAAYGIPRKQFFLGGFLKGGDWAYDRLVRLFKPQFARYNEASTVHEQFIVKGTIGYLQSTLEHYSHPDMKTLLAKFDSYTSLQIKDITVSIPVAILKFIFVPPYVFMRWMIWHHGYKDGLRGILAGAMRSYYDYMLWGKFIKAKF